MATRPLWRTGADTATPPPEDRRPIGRHLVDMGAITQEQLVAGLKAQLHLAAPLGEILIAEGWATAGDVQTALARQFGLPAVDPGTMRPDSTLCALREPGFWLVHHCVPLDKSGGVVRIATARPDRFAQVEAALGGALGPVVPVLAGRSDIAAALAREFRLPLAQAANTRVPPVYSCRGWGWVQRATLPVLIGAVIAALWYAPAATLAALCLIALATLAMFTILKITAFAISLTQADLWGDMPEERKPASPATLPKISVLVPLFREKEIVGQLIPRLMRLTYPKALLDVILVLEEADAITRETLHDADLPPWMRVIEVPATGPITTKPRAMNYALDFCDGEIVGVWDAEDAPAPDQLERIARRFADAPADTVCLQGILDYYNPRTNWLARCFTIEYSAWFRLILPGIAWLRLAVPLGGTTLFMRRDKLEELGGWDAHNVTEDADLGMRLCRAGYRTEMIETVTYEEANCRAWPWIKQRSRWLKGFLVTYLVHMRAPLRLLRDLGVRRFLGFQAFFLGTLCQFLLAPVLWSFWLLLLGMPHPVAPHIPLALLYSAAGFLVFCEVLSFTIGAIAVARGGRHFLIPWVAAMMFYFPLGVIAVYKALIELIVAPFFWDKTQHGIATADWGTPPPLGGGQAPPGG